MIARNYIRVFSILFILFILTTAVRAQNKPPVNYSSGKTGGIIRGRIVDAKSGHGIEYATIAVYSAVDSTVAGGTISKASGHFDIRDIKPGKYYVRISFIGYERANFDKIIIDSEHRNIDLGVIKLKSASTNLEAVEIVAEQQYVEYQIDKKVVNVQSNLEAAGGNAVDALENVPSVSVDIDGNVSLRGSGNFQVLINGKPTPLSSSDALQQIPAAAIKNIEIITNPSAKYDPDGMTGIVNVVLKDNVQQGVNGLVEASYSSFGSWNLNALLNYRKNKINYFVGVNARRRKMPGSGNTELDNFINPDTTVYQTGELDRNRRRDNYTFKGGLDFYLDKKNTISVEGAYIISDNARDYTTRTYEYDDPFSYELYSISDNGGKRQGDYFKGSLNWDYNDKKKKARLVSMLYFSKGNSEKEEIQAEYLSDADWMLSDVILTGLNTTDKGDDMEFRFKSDFTKELKNKQKFEAGIQSRNTRENTDFIFNQYDTLTKDWVYRPDYSSQLVFNRDIISLYATYGGMYKNFGYQLGLRGEYTNRVIDSKLAQKKSTINRFDIFPTVHLSQKIGKTNEVMASYSRRIDRPGGWELDPNPIFISSNFVRVGNMELEPEYTDNFELSYQKTLGSSFISLEAYYRTTKNMITRLREIDDNNITYMTFANINRDHAAGGELMFNWRITKWLKLNLSGTYYYYLIEANEESNTEEQQSNNYRLNGNLNVNITRLMKLQLTAFYRGPSATAQGTIGAFNMVNAALRYDFFNRKLAVTFKVRDIFQTMKHEIYSYSDTFESHNTFYRKSPVFSITASYRINNYKQQRKPGMDDMEQGGSEDDI